MHRDDEVQEVERIQLQRVAQGVVREEIVDLRLGCDLLQEMEYHVAQLLAGHSASGSWSRRSMAARKRAPR